MYIDSINTLNNYFISTIIATLFSSCFILLDHFEEKMKLREEKMSIEKTKSFSPIHKSSGQSMYNFVIAFIVFTRNDFLLPISRYERRLSVPFNVRTL